MTLPTPPTTLDQPSAFDLNKASLAETSLPTETLRLRWEAIHKDANAIAKMAQLACEPMTGPVYGCPEMLGTMSGTQRDFAFNTLADIEIMLKPGLSALQNLQKGGVDVTAPALALWCEFHHCRQTLLDMANPNRLT